VGQSQDVVINRQRGAHCDLRGWNADELAVTPKEPLAPPLPALYSPDWRADFHLGDDPYRYYRW
jgi:hypothetical protein